MHRYANNKVSIELVKTTDKIINNCNVLNALNRAGYILNNKNSELLYRLYLDLKSSQDEINRSQIKHIERTVDSDKTISEELLEDLTNRYVDVNIRDFILRTQSVEIKYSLSERIEYIIYFRVFEEVDNDLLEYLDMCSCNIFSILKFLYKFRNHDCDIERLELYIYLTDFRKVLPTSKRMTIGPGNINSGSTRPCQKRTKITIFRREEFMKLVVHESVHALGIDIPYRYNGYYTEKLDQIFGIESSYNLNETYTEMCAVIVNSLMMVLQSDHLNTDKKTIQKLIANCLHIETAYSRIQVIKILHFMTLSLKDLVTQSKKENYKEESHVFAYYILKYLLLENLGGFLDLCGDNEGHVLNFSHGLSDNAKREKIEKIIKLIQSLIKNKDFLDKFARDEKYLLSPTCPFFKGIITKTLRMTALELA